MNIAAMVLAGGITAATMAPISPPAAAAEYTCGGEVCIRVVADEKAALKDAHGCNFKTCVTLTGNASKYYITGSGHGFFGHVHIWGPGVNRYSDIEPNPSITLLGRGAGKACAEGWDLRQPPTGASVGLACKDVR